MQWKKEEEGGGRMKKGVNDVAVRLRVDEPDTKRKEAEAEGSRALERARRLVRESRACR